jgi:glycerol-3-phosphate acyltransferase PlsY
VITSEFYLVGITSYLIGSISFAILVSRRLKLADPRTYGSMNAGATNLLRGGSKIGAALALVGDALKGWVVIYGVKEWLTFPGHNSQWLIMVASIGVFLGHGYPIFFRFKGGKGVATCLGVLCALNPHLGLSTTLVWLSVMLVTRISSLSAICASVAAPFFGMWLLPSWPERLTVLILTLLLLLHHQANIRKLIRGEETVFRKK